MVSLARSSLLLLAPIGLLIVVAVAARATRQPLGRVRRMGSLAVRFLMVLLLTCALSGPVWTRMSEFPRATVFLADVSESIPAGALDKALADLKPHWDREVALGNRCALVAFAGGTKILIPPGTRPLDVLTIPPDESLHRSSTDFTRAFDSARSLAQSQFANRIVLLTDGIDSTRPARRVDIPPATIALPLAGPAGDVAIVDVQAPVAVRSGEPFDIRVTIATDHAGEARLSVVLDETALPESTRRFRLPGPGRHVLVLPALQQKAAFAAGLHRLLVMAESAGDHEPRNNVGLAAITVTGKPRVLLVEGTPRDGEFLARLLGTQDIEFVRKSPPELVPGAEALDEYVAVILAGVPRETLPSSTVAALKTYVEQTGGGLWVVGAPALQGGRGYAGSELEKLLPVSFSDAVAPIADNSPKKETPPAPPPPTPPTPDPEDAKPTKVLAPSVALLLIVDKSGSMAGRNIEIVKETCIASANALSRRDLIGVVAFDHRPYAFLEFTEAERIDYITQRILRLYADGGTRICPALELAERMFEVDARAQRCAIKHAVLLSDGDAPPADNESVVRRMAEAGITVSTVCVSGAKFDAVLMSQIANWGKGRFYFTPSFEKVRQLIVNETQKVIATLPKDDKKAPPPAPAPKTADPPPPAVPPPPPPPNADKPPPLQPVVLKDAHEILAGIDGKSLPGLRGRLAAAAKPKADVPLATKEGQAILALGRLGLGKTAVWASDLSSPWSADWLGWKDSPKLFAQLVRFLSGSGPDAELAGRVRFSRDGAGALLCLDAAGPGGALTVTDAASGAVLPIEQDPDGDGRVRIALDQPGELRRLKLQRADGKKVALGAIRAYDEEFAPREPSRDLFAAGLQATSVDQLDRILGETHVSGEERRDLIPWLVIGALLLLPLDVALRRIMTG
ncbi:MAG TPA: VWA domain-containing protein [Planctomycetota bacterium]|nr:VWA domain-containing protein [Planctomycetota bacterium]